MARKPDTESSGSSSQNIDERPVDIQVLSQSQPTGSCQEQEESEDERTQVVRDLLDEDEDKDSEQIDELAPAEEDEDEQGAGSPRGNKRARMEEGVEVVVKNEKPRRTGMLPRHKDGYVPGSIVRVKLHQFLTYDDVEFRPGPHLNMVLGPNGTGKSSIACALCLGLNFPPNVLGRATHLKAFVKQGYKEGFIEIELKGREDGKSLVIRRILNDKMERQQQFLLNGQSVSAKVISEEVERLGIQVNNLCTFLPQDKVAEFARMTPQELLIATEKAAGNENLLAWHTSLIETGVNLKKLASELATEQSELETLERRNTNLEKEVNAYKQRREIERRIELLEVVLPVKEYTVAKEKYGSFKEKRKKAHDKVQELDARNKPVTEFREKLIEDQRKADEQRDEKKRQVMNKLRSLQDILTRSRALQENGDKVADDLVSLKNEEKERRTRIARIKKEIHDIEEMLAHPPDTEDLSVIEAERRAIQNERQELEKQQYDLKEQIQPFVDESAKQVERVRRATVELQTLDSLAHRKLEMLERWDKSCAEVVKWLRQNQNRFRMEVIEPACLSVEVKDQRYASIIEAGFNATQLKTFVFQCKEDYKLFNELICDSGQGMGRPYKVGCWQKNMGPEDVNPLPLTHEELRELGFDGYGIDFVNYPPGMLGFLQDQPNLHRYAVAFRGERVDMSRAAELISRPLDGGKGGGGSFATGNVLSMVTRSRYGQRKAQNLTREIQRARTFNNAPVDPERKRRIDQDIEEARVLKEEAEANIARISNQIMKGEQAISDLDRRKKQNEDRKKTVHDVQRKLQTARLKLSQKQEALAREENAPSLGERREILRQEGFKIARQRADVVKRLQDAIKGVIEIHREATILGLKYLQAGANKAALDALVEAQDTEYGKAKQDYNEAQDKFIEAKRIAKEKLEVTRTMFAHIDDELRKTYEELEEDFKERTDDSIQEEIDSLRAKLGLLLVTNSGVIEQYEKRQRDIDKLRIKVEEHETQKAKTERRIQKTKDRWFPALQELVSNIGEKFSAAFERVHCAGEVRISENADDYANWAIDILVKFRDTEQLQLLTGQRQSGGERALTTIMYLMSLTELARAPFSLVDEINQGMDARYERAVHNSLVEVTCRAESGQYFLITPKLLTDLKYHERMKVLCVSNGEWLPEENTGGNMMSMIKNFVEHRAGAQ